ncbi:hypothetical protein B0H10DRAFT_786392 [Mycena sp. CBHHK59/15]|nr:hypothetical protein B0H10DRAFT_786392 [Mycena sp. CBHHK59/15]
MHGTVLWALILSSTAVAPILIGPASNCGACHNMHCNLLQGSRCYCTEARSPWIEDNRRFGFHCQSRRITMEKEALHTILACTIRRWLPERRELDPDDVPNFGSNDSESARGVQRAGSKSTETEYCGIPAQ